MWLLPWDERHCLEELFWCIRAKGLQSCRKPIYHCAGAWELLPVVTNKRGHLPAQFFPHSFPQFVSDQLLLLFWLWRFWGNRVCNVYMMRKWQSPEYLVGLFQLTGVLVRSEPPFCGRMNWWCWFLLAEGLVFLGISEDCWCIGWGRVPCGSICCSWWWSVASFRCKADSVCLWLAWDTSTGCSGISNPCGMRRRGWNCNEKCHQNGIHCRWVLRCAI